MSSGIPIPLQKLTSIWSARREKNIAIRVSYTVEDGDCRIFRIDSIEELD